MQVPAKARQHAGKRVCRLGRLDEPSSEGTSSSVSGLNPSSRQGIQQLPDALDCMMAIRKGGIPAQVGVPYQGVGGGAGAGTNRLLHMQQLAQGGDAGARKVEEVVVDAVGQQGAAEVGVAPQRGCPAPVAQHQGLPRDVLNGGQLPQARMQAEKGRGQGGDCARGALRRVGRPQQEAQGVGTDLRQAAARGRRSIGG